MDRLKMALRVFWMEYTSIAWMAWPAPFCGFMLGMLGGAMWSTGNLAPLDLTLFAVLAPAVLLALLFNLLVWWVFTRCVIVID